MVQIGLIRRIDGLGRIVVPKEIRKTLRIQNGECFEVFLKENEIILKKYSAMSKYPELLEYLINTISELYNDEFLLTDLNKIIYISKKQMQYIVDDDLENKYISLINDGKRYSEKKELPISEKFLLNCDYVVEPLLINGDVIGSIILFKNENITDVDISSLDLVRKILINYLEE